MTIVAGRARFSLGTLPRDDFPVIAEGELPTQFELSVELLKQIIDKTRFAISTEETRYISTASSCMSPRITASPC